MKPSPKHHGHAAKDHEIHTPSSKKKETEAEMLKKVEHAKFHWKRKDEAEFEEVEPEWERDEEQMVKGLSAIYVDEKTGEVPDLDKFERKRSWWWVKFLLILTLVSSTLSFAAWMGFFYLKPFEQVQTTSVAFALTGPETVTIGQEQTYEVDYRNQAVQPLNEADVRIVWPADFEVTSMMPAPTDRELHRWQLGLLPVGMHDKITVKGVFVGAVGGQGAIQAFMTFRGTAASEAVQQVLETKAVHYVDTVLDVQVTGPTKVLSGDAVPIYVQVVNRGAQPLGDLAVRVATPLAFAVDGASSTKGGRFSSSTREWILPLPVLAPHTTSTVTMIGTFPSSVFGDMAFRGEVGRLSSSTFVAYQQKEIAVPVLVGDLTVKLVANGKDSDFSVEPGEPLRLSLSYQNTSPEELKQTLMRLEFESFVDGKSVTGTSLVDWNNVQLGGKGTTSTKAKVQAVIYDKATVPGLDVVPAQAEQTFDVTIPTKILATSTKDGAIVVRGIATVAMVGATKVNRVVQTVPMRIRYRTDAMVTSEARYFSEEGAPYGFGPLPPVTGKTTAYRVFWRLDKRWHGLKDVQVTATLPRRVAWSALTHAESGQLSYNTSTREVTWTMKQVPEQTRELEAWFEVQLTPDLVDVGRFADLLGESQIQFTDELLNEVISRIQPAISTDLPQDDGAKGKGVVRKALDK